MKRHRRQAGSSHSQRRRDERPPFFSVDQLSYPAGDDDDDHQQQQQHIIVCVVLQSIHHQSDAKRGRVCQTRSRVSSYEDQSPKNDENKNVNSNTSSSNARRKGRKARCGTIDSTIDKINLVSPPRIVKEVSDYVTLRDDVDSAKKGARSRWDMFDRRAYGDLAPWQRTSGIGDVTSRS